MTCLPNVILLCVASSVTDNVISKSLSSHPDRLVLARRRAVVPSVLGSSHSQATETVDGLTRFRAVYCFMDQFECHQVLHQFVLTKESVRLPGLYIGHFCLYNYYPMVSFDCRRQQFYIFPRRFLVLN